MSVTRVLVVDPHPLSAGGLALLISNYASIETWTCKAHDEVASYLDGHFPQAVIVNLYPESIAEGIRICELSTMASNNPKVIVLALRSLVEKGTVLVDAVAAGAHGILVHEDLQPKQLLDILQETDGRQAAIDPRQLRNALARWQQSSAFSALNLQGVERLTPREVEIAKFMSEGTSTTEIAAELSISGRTVQTHIGNILSKLGVRTRVEAVVYLNRNFVLHDGPTMRR